MGFHDNDSKTYGGLEINGNELQNDNRDYGYEFWQTKRAQSQSQSQKAPPQTNPRYDGEDPQLSNYDPDQLALDIDELKQELEKTVKTQVDGPMQSREYIDKYFKKHPEHVKEIDEYMDVLNNVKQFREKNPIAEAGSYDAITYERIADKDLGNYCVTFHQNYTLDDRYGAYSDRDYAAMCVIAKHELNAEHMYIGTYGNPEISFDCSSFNKAMTFAIENNQESIYCPYLKQVRHSKNGDPATIENTNYNDETNPIVD